jgi:hypothetical protein
MEDKIEQTEGKSNRIEQTCMAAMITEIPYIKGNEKNISEEKN